MSNINTILEDFFNFERPCPQEIPLCEEVRNSYKKELANLENTPGCSSCAKGKLKSRYMEAVWKEATSSLSKPT